MANVELNPPNTIKCFLNICPLRSPLRTFSGNTIGQMRSLAVINVGIILIFTHLSIDEIKKKYICITAILYSYW